MNTLKSLLVGRLACHNILGCFTITVQLYKCIHKGVQRGGRSSAPPPFRDNLLSVSLSLSVHPLCIHHKWFLWPNIEAVFVYWERTILNGFAFFYIVMKYIWNEFVLFSSNYKFNKMFWYLPGKNRIYIKVEIKTDGLIEKIDIKRSIDR